MQLPEPVELHSLKQILLPENVKKQMLKLDISDEEISKILTSFPIKSVETKNPGEFNLEQFEDKVQLQVVRKKSNTNFKGAYANVVMAFVIVLKKSFKITTVYDTSSGSVIQAKFPRNLHTRPGILSITIVPKNPLNTFVTGEFQLKGQSVDWGRGEKMLQSVFSLVEQHLQILNLKEFDLFATEPELLKDITKTPECSANLKSFIKFHIRLNYPKFSRYSNQWCYLYTE